jgi:hypothetical protein
VTESFVRANGVGGLDHTIAVVIFRSTCTMTSPMGFAKMMSMRNVVIMAMVAFGAVRIMWRVLSPAQPPAFATEWAADE